jgi:hypothetical protein
MDRKLTHEGAPAALHLTIEQQLRRSILSCLLWEKEFYEDGQSIADRIVELAGQAPPAMVAALAIEARTAFNLRHVPLLLISVLAKTGAGTRLVSDTIKTRHAAARARSRLPTGTAAVNGATPATRFRGSCRSHGGYHRPRPSTVRGRQGRR